MVFATSLVSSLALVFASSVLANIVDSSDDAYAPQGWYILPEEQSEVFNDRSIFDRDRPSRRFRRATERVFAAQGNTFERMTKVSHLSDGKKGGWSLKRITADVGLTAKGNIGVLALGGTVAVQTFWFRRPLYDGIHKKEENLGSADPADIEMDLGASLDKVNGEVSMLTSLFLKRGMIDSREPFSNNLRKVITETQAVAGVLPQKIAIIGFRRSSESY